MPPRITGTCCSLVQVFSVFLEQFVLCWINPLWILQKNYSILAMIADGTKGHLRYSIYSVAATSDVILQIRACNYKQALGHISALLNSRRNLSKHRISRYTVFTLCWLSLGCWITPESVSNTWHRILLHRSRALTQESCIKTRSVLWICS